MPPAPRWGSFVFKLYSHPLTFFKQGDSHHRRCSKPRSRGYLIAHRFLCGTQAKGHFSVTLDSHCIDYARLLGQSKVKKPFVRHAPFVVCRIGGCSFIVTTLVPRFFHEVKTEKILVR